MRRRGAWVRRSPPSSTSRSPPTTWTRRRRTTRRAHLPGGLLVSQDGYTLHLAETTLRPGSRPIAFTITGPDGEPVTAYDTEHEKQLHLVAVRRDGSRYQHVHPILGADATWRTDLDLVPGTWRVFADFTPAGDDGLTLGADLIVPGRVTTAPMESTTTAEVDGYTVRLTGQLTAEESSDLAVVVERDGEPVTDLEPYLGAFGHLVALRAGDLAYLHVHPEESAAGPRSPSSRRCRAPATSTSTSTSSTTVSSAPPSSTSRRASTMTTASCPASSWRSPG